MLLQRLYWISYLAYHLRGQRRYAFRPLEAIRRDQTRRVRNIVAHAYRHVPYYRETMMRLGLTPQDFQAAEDLAKLPILEREQLQRDPERFVSDARPRERYLRLHTSGSSGRPVVVYWDTAALFRTAAQFPRCHAAITARLGRIAGCLNTTIFYPASASSSMVQFWHQRSFLRRSPRRWQALSLLDPPEKNLPLLNAFQPDILWTYGSYLEMLFGHVRKSGCAFHRPKLCIYGGDMLSDAARRLITEDFGIPVLSGYQSVEALRISFECEQHRGLHVNSDLYPIRIVDGAGRTVPPGETGEVVLSTPLNRATVLLNYRLGDLAALLPDPCPCGRSLPLMSFPQGRCNDFIHVPSGATVHPMTLCRCSVDEPGIWQCQFVQDTPTHFRVNIVADETCNRQRVRQNILAEFENILGGEVGADVAFVDSIGRTPAGKRRMVISQVEA